MDEVVTAFNWFGDFWAAVNSPKIGGNSTKASFNFMFAAANRKLLNFGNIAFAAINNKR